jgi:hypothetical protein
MYCVRLTYPHACAPFVSSQARLCADVGNVMKAEMTSSGDKVAAWARAWREVYALADAVMANVEAKHAASRH